MEHDLEERADGLLQAAGVVAHGPPQLREQLFEIAGIGAEVPVRGQAELVMDHADPQAVDRIGPAVVPGEEAVEVLALQAPQPRGRARILQQARGLGEASQPGVKRLQRAPTPFDEALAELAQQPGLAAGEPDEGEPPLHPLGVELECAGHALDPLRHPWIVTRQGPYLRGAGHLARTSGGRWAGRQGNAPGRRRLHGRPPRPRRGIAAPRASGRGRRRAGSPTRS